MFIPCLKISAKGSNPPILSDLFYTINFDYNMYRTLLRTLVLDNDIIEIHFNPRLTKNPYLIRVFSYNNEPDEYRASEDDVKNLYSFLKNNKIL